MRLGANVPESDGRKRRVMSFYHLAAERTNLRRDDC